MTACAIRYRLDGPGPAAFLVECEGELRVYARGTLGGAMPQSRVAAFLAERGCRWIPAGGEILLDLSAEDKAMRHAEAASRLAIDPAAIPRHQVETVGLNA